MSPNPNTKEDSTGDELRKVLEDYKIALFAAREQYPNLPEVESEVADKFLLNYVLSQFISKEEHRKALLEARSKGFPWSEGRIKAGGTENFHGVVSITNNNDADIIVAIKRAEPRAQLQESESKNNG